MERELFLAVKISQIIHYFLIKFLHKCYPIKINIGSYHDAAIFCLYIGKYIFVKRFFCKAFTYIQMSEDFIYWLQSFYLLKNWWFMIYFWIKTAIDMKLILLLSDFFTLDSNSPKSFDCWNFPNRHPWFTNWHMNTIIA